MQQEVLSKMTKKDELAKKTNKIEEEKESVEVEQSIWSVKINSQLLYKKAVNGRTILLGMTSEENEKVAEVMEKAIDELARVLENRTTQHEAPISKEQLTIVDSINSEVSINAKESTEELDDAPATVAQETAEDKEDKKNEKTAKDSGKEEEKDIKEKNSETTHTNAKKEKTKKKSSIKNFWEKLG